MSIYDKASLVLIPSGTKTSKVYSQKPVSGDGDFTFSRSTAATRVNADGLIEKETQNLLLQSNTFDTTWTPFLATLTSGQSGYDGTNNAWKIERTNTGTRVQQSISVSGVNTFSVYAKAGSLNWIEIINTSSPFEGAFFDIANGVVGTTDSDTIDTNITSVGGGWYRIEFSLNYTGTTNFRISPADSDGVKSGSSGNIYIQDAQLNQGLIAQEVITTTTTAVEGGITDNVPRLDYTDSSCPALLLEPQRTNLVTQSEYYDTGNGYFNAFALHDIVTNTTATTSPTGDYSASKIIPDTSDSSNHNIYGSNVTSGTKYAVSIFAKAAEYDYLIIRGLGLGGSGGARFNISTGVVEGVAGYDSATIEDYGNGWYRCIAIGTATSTTGAYYHASPTAAFTSFQGNNSDGIYIYGAQIEAGSYATSYIPTYGSAVTRNADDAVVNYTEISDTEGTLFWQGFVDISADSYAVALSDSTGGAGSNRILFYRSKSNNKMWLYMQSAGASVINQAIELPTDVNDKFAFAWKANDFIIYHNGVQKYTLSSGAVPTGMEYVQFNEWNNAHEETNKTKQALYFPTRITNAELADLTTL